MLSGEFCPETYDFGLEVLTKYGKSAIIRVFK